MRASPRRSQGFLGDSGRCCHIQALLGFNACHPCPAPRAPRPALTAARPVRRLQTSVDHRGTAQQPGLVVTLLPSADADVTGSAALVSDPSFLVGVAYRVRSMQQILPDLDVREKNGYQFIPRPAHARARSHTHRRTRVRAHARTHASTRACTHAPTRKHTHAHTTHTHHAHTAAPQARTVLSYTHTLAHATTLLSAHPLQPSGLSPPMPCLQAVKHARPLTGTIQYPAVRCAPRANLRG